MQLHPVSEGELEPEGREFYRRALMLLRDAALPFLVGGAYALARYTGINRHTTDFEIFVLPRDADRALTVLAEAGLRTELTFPHWLGKAFWKDYFVDIIFSAGNGVAEVDDLWLANAVDETLFGMPVKLIPAEEMIWQRVLARFGSYWRVLLTHLVLFGFIYPGERDRIPGWVMDDLMRRLTVETTTPPRPSRLCQGTLISRAQYLIDVGQWGYKDARLQPRGNMTRSDVAHWTAAIDESE
jgi:hypothetical protein